MSGSKLPSTAPDLERLIAYFARKGSTIEDQVIPHPAGQTSEIASMIEGKIRQAAVLIPVVKPDVGTPSRIILTVRSDSLSRHAGQVSLPGGTREQHDTDDFMTALREAEEEVGLSPDNVEIIGRLGRILLPTGFEVTPVIGLVEPDSPLAPCPIEVEEIFLAPTSLLLNPASYHQITMDYRGTSRQVLELNYEGYRIWGATASILHFLASRLAEDV